MALAHIMENRVKIKVEEECDHARELMKSHLAASPLGDTAAQYMQSLGLGKMLRAKMVFRLGMATGADAKRLQYSAAAIEMTHTASLLHDDVIDGGSLRRGVPSFWVEHGVQGAILMGDMILFKAIQLIKEAGDEKLADELIGLTSEVCMAEVEQELVRRGVESEWDVCVGLARRKTGSLFAFGGYATGTDPAMAAALKEAGYLVGTAYQLGDDIFDASGNTARAHKTLGSDSRRNKVTAATASSAGRNDAHQQIEELCREAGAQLDPWPDLRRKWDGFMEETIKPVLNDFLAQAKLT